MKKNKKLNIIYTVDDAYIKQAAVSIESVIENNPNRVIDFYLCTDKDDKTENFKRIKKFYKDNNLINFIFVDCKKYDQIFEEHKMDKWGSNSYYIYWRHVVFDLIDVDEAIYLDADILCLKEFEFPNLKGNTVGCVIDCVHPHYNDVLGVPRDLKLYNTGTMFVDVKKWKNNNCTKRQIDYLNIKDKYLMADQDIFSIVLQNEILDLSPSYNYFAGYDYYGVNNFYSINNLAKKAFYTIDEIEAAKNNIMFYHCLDGVFKRPWVNGNNHPAKEMFKKYMINSAWEDITYDKSLSGIFVIEKKLEILPDFIYNKVHRFALWLNFEVNKSKLK